MPIISLLAVIASCVLGFMLQKNCKTVGIRFRGKRLDESKKMVIADVLEVYVKNGEYFAKCRVQGTWSEPTIKIDKTMMAAMPDSTSNDGKPIKQVLLYERSEDKNNIEYSLTPEEIRFKTKLKVIQDEKNTDAEIQNAMDVIALYYDIRLVLWTLAWVGVYRSPLFSILFSVLAGVISARNIIPLRCTKLKQCGIINAKKEGTSSKKERSAVPPGYDNWSEESQYIYNLEQRVEAQKNSGACEPSSMSPSSSNEAAESEIAVKVQDDVPSDVGGDAESMDNDSAEKAAEEAESDSEEEDEPFFTDEELAAEEDGEDGEYSEEAIGEMDRAEAAEGDSDAEDDEDDEFDADGFESDSLNADSPHTGQEPDPAKEPSEDKPQAEESAAVNATEQKPAGAAKNKAKAKTSSRHAAKRNVQAVLNKLMGEDDTDDSENIS